MPGRGVISWEGPVCGRTLPVRAWYNPDGRHTYVGLGVRSAAYANKINSWNGRCCTGIQLCPFAATWCKWRKYCWSFCSQAKSDALTRMSRYLTFSGRLFRWSWYWLAMARGGQAHDGASLRDHLSIWLLFSRAGFVLKEGQLYMDFNLLSINSIYIYKYLNTYKYVYIYINSGVFQI